MVRVAHTKRRYNVTLSIPAACVLLLFNRSDSHRLECPLAASCLCPNRATDVVANTEMGADLVTQALRSLVSLGYTPDTDPR